MLSALYRAGPKRREVDREGAAQMEEAGVVDVAVVDWALPVVFVPKKIESFRFCADYCRLNAVTIRGSYPVSRMKECLDSLGRAKLFSTLDANSGWWEIETN